MLDNLFGPDLIYRIPALLIAITFHEYAHALTAFKMGDPTPKYSGRLTMNPLAHLDPIGLLMLWIFKFGWAKPVPVNPYHFRDPKKGMFYVAFAGPLSNIILAFITMLILKMNVVRWVAIYIILRLLLSYNLILAVFNLIPLPPLDGSKILMAILPGHQAQKFSSLESYGPIILIALLYLGLLDGILWTLITFLNNMLNMLTNFLINII